MATKYLDSNGLLYFWQKIKAFFVSDVTYDSTTKTLKKTKNGADSNVVTLATVATSGSYNDLSNKPTIPAAVQPTTTTPKMNGTAAVGTETKYAKGDHVHPSDISRVPTSRTVNGKALSSDVSLTDRDIESELDANTTVFDQLSSMSQAVRSKQDTLVSGTNIKTVNGNSLLGSGNMDIVAGVSDVQSDGVSVVTDGVANIDTFTRPTTSEAGTKGLVPAPPVVSDPSYNTQDYFLTASGYWGKVTFSRLINNNTQSWKRTTTIGGATYNWTVDFDNVTTSVAGFMSPSDKTKLNGIASGATEVALAAIEDSSNVTLIITNSEGDDVRQTISTGNYNDLYNKPTIGAAAAKGVVTSISADSADLPTTTAVKNYVSSAVTGAVAYQGIAPTSFAPTNYKAGWYWIIGTAGTYCGQACEAGDMIFCKTAASTYAAANFDVVQTNLDITSITNAEIDTIVAA